MAHVLDPQAFRQTLDGRQTDLFTLQGAGGLRVAVSNYGARLVQVAVPDPAAGPDGLADVALGYDSLNGYLNGQPSMGALIGRWAGRLREGRLALPGGARRQLPTNSGPHHHHGGPKGSRFQVFAVEDVRADAITLGHTFREGDDGVPGTLHLRLQVAVADDNALHLAWTAQAADAPTLANITGHAFFNLAGVGSTHGHMLQVPASRFVPLAADICPTGSLADVQGTPFDFRKSRAVGDAASQSSEQLAMAGGLDHYLVLDALPPAGRAPRSSFTPEGLRMAALLAEPASGRRMEVWSTAPGLQVYAGHGLRADPLRDKGRGPTAEGWLWQPGDGICLEPMAFPDAPNQPAFPVRWLQPGEKVQGAIVYRFA